MNHEMLSWITSVSQRHCICFSSIKKLCLQRKISSDSKNLIALILINNICCSKTKTKKSKRPKRIWIKPWLKNKNDKKTCVKRKIHYPFKWIQLIERSNYLNMNSRLHLSNKLKECGKFLWIRLWNLCFISMKESIFSKVAGCKPVTSLNWTPS